MKQETYHRTSLPMATKITIFCIFLLCTFFDRASYPCMGNTLTLDGYDEYAWATHSGSLDLTGDQLTMEAWVKLAGPTENHRIVSKQNIELNRSYGFYISGENRRVMPSIHADWHFEGEVGEGVLECGMDLDQDVGGSDLAVVCLAFGSSTGAPNCNPAANFNGDGTVDAADLAVTALGFGRTNCGANP